MSLNLKDSKDLEFIFSFLKRTSQEQMVMKYSALEIRVAINKQTIMLETLNNFLDQQVFQRVRGYVLEEKFFKSVSSHLMAKPHCFIHRIVKSNEIQDKNGIDFFLSVTFNHKDFRVPIDVKLSHRADRLSGKDKSYKPTLYVTPDLLEKRMSEVLNKLDRLVAAYYKRTFLKEHVAVEKFHI